MDQEVRELALAAARNPHTPPEILAVLAQDEDPAVQRAAARNPATPVNTSGDPA